MDTRKKIKNVKLNTIFWSFIIFLAIVIYLHYKATTDNFKFFDLFTNQNFHISFLASAYEDVLFFIVIGIFLFVLGNKSPEEDMLENRINHLFTNNGHVDTFVLNKSREDLKRLAVYSDETDVIIDIIDAIEYDNKKLLKIGFEKTYSLKSLIHDLDNLTTTGKLEFYGENNAKLPNDEYGMITILELRCHNNGTTKISQNEPLIEEHKVFSFDEKFNKDDTVTLYANFWMWMLDGDTIFHAAYRNTSNTNISVRNKLTEDIIITLTDSKEETLKSQDSLTIIEGQAMESLEKVNFKVKSSNVKKETK